MREKKSFAEHFDAFFNGKGFYIVLFVCAAIIGVSAWALLFQGEDGDVIEDDMPVMNAEAGGEDGLSVFSEDEYLDMGEAVSGGSGGGSTTGEQSVRVEPPKVNDEPVRPGEKQPAGPAVSVQEEQPEEQASADGQSGEDRFEDS